MYYALCPKQGIIWLAEQWLKWLVIDWPSGLWQLWVMGAGPAIDSMALGNLNEILDMYV